MLIMVVILQIDDDTVDDDTNTDDTAIHTFLVNTRVLIHL